MSKRHAKDFNRPGVRFSEGNPRGKNADWLQFACTDKETDKIMFAIGTAIKLYPDRKDVPAGTLLARICDDWVKRRNS